MDVENTSTNSQQFVILLGKKYPVIQCTNEMNSIDTLVSHSKDTNETESIVNGSTTAEGIAGDFVVDQSEDVVPSSLDEFSTQVSDATQAIQLSLDQLEKEDVVPNESSDINNDMNNPDGGTIGLDLAELAEETPEVQAVGDLPSTDDAVALALSINEPTDHQAFEYAVPSDGNDTSEAGDNECPNTELEAPERLLENEEANDRNDVPEDNDNVALLHQNPSDANDASTNNGLSSSQIAESAIEQQQHVIEIDGDSDSVVSVSGKLVITEYAQSEWKGTTYTAQCLRNGYQTLVDNTGCTFMRKVRGDNYCALRATAFQIFSQNISICGDDSDWKSHVKTLPDILINECNCSWIVNWSFANRLQFDSENRLNLMQECLDYFVEQKELSNAMENAEDRVAYFYSLFNSGSNAEIKLFEALKLMMLKTAVDLHQFQSRGEDVPVFAWLLFARDSSENPESLMMNHLNLAGNTGGLEQVSAALVKTLRERI